MGRYCFSRPSERILRRKVFLFNSAPGTYLAYHVDGAFKSSTVDKCVFMRSKVQYHCFENLLFSKGALETVWIMILHFIISIFIHLITELFVISLTATGSKSTLAFKTCRKLQNRPDQLDPPTSALFRQVRSNNHFYYGENFLISALSPSCLNTTSNTRQMKNLFYLPLFRRKI